MTEREKIADYLERRAKFWDQYASHVNVAKTLRNEALAIRNGEFEK